MHTKNHVVYLKYVYNFHFKKIKNKINKETSVSLGGSSYAPLKIVLNSLQNKAYKTSFLAFSFNKVKEQIFVIAKGTSGKSLTRCKCKRHLEFFPLNLGYNLGRKKRKTYQRRCGPLIKLG